jgi:hypothetical protein
MKRKKKLHVTMKRVPSTYNTSILGEKRKEEKQKRNTVNNSTETDSTISVITKP